MNELIQEALYNLDHNPKYKSDKDGSYEQAYHCLQNSADRMSDDQFMFEAGRRSARLEMKAEFTKKVSKAIKDALEKVFAVDK